VGEDQSCEGWQVKALANGQLWKLDHSRMEIMMLGKTLVHYRVFKGDAKRATRRGLLNRLEFGQYLKENRARLVKG